MFAFSPTFIVAVATVAGMGSAVTAAGIGGQVLVQSAIHDEMRGRVMGLWGIIMREECRPGPSCWAPLTVGSASVGGW